MILLFLAFQIQIFSQTFEEIENKNENGSTSSPIPMISWLRKF
jgi:hypothetical protein